MWWLTAMALFLPGQYAAHRSKIPIRLTHCVMRLTKSGNGLKRFLLTVVTGGIAKDIEKDFAISLEVSNTPNGTKGFIPKPLRWVVERTFSWLDWFRRLSRNYEESTEVAEEMIDLAAIKILLNQI